MLLFKKKFLELIRCGEKTQTIRFWDRCRMKAGQRSYIPGIGYVSILAVDPVEIDCLSDEDARLDGFTRASLLQEELRTLYSEEIRKGFFAFRIRFSVYPPEEQIRMRRERELAKEERRLQDRRHRDAAQQEYVERTLAKLRRLVQN